MSDSIAARPRTLSSGRRWPPKNGPIISTTAHVLARYLRKKSCTVAKTQLSQHTSVIQAEL